MFSKKRILALTARFLSLALVVSVLAYMANVAFMAGEILIGSVIVVILVAMFLVYGSRRTVPLKFLFPGIVLLVTFVLVPILYTIAMSGFVYKTGNEISKQEAITQIFETGYTEDANGTMYYMTLGKYEGQLAALLTDVNEQIYYLGFDNEAQLLDQNAVQLDEYGTAISVTGFSPITPEEASSQEDKIVALRFSLGENQGFIRPDALDSASLMIQAYTYDSSTDELIDSVNQLTYVDNGQGNFVNVNDPNDVLYPGWREFSLFGNYTSLVLNPVIRGPFVNVFIWTFTFALTTVFTMFVAGLFLALALDKKLKFGSIYKSVLILPYAIPSFMSILIWNGMFNREFGAVNQLLGVQIDWYNDAILAKVIILIVNLWLGIPYFYLISSGALQALPGDLEEAAAIDGAKPFQILTQIKLPLLLQILSPLLIASFAFNFNNFNLIYLLTNGGPTDVLSGETAGATDILITYAYKTAFGSTEQNFGLASAISVLMFLIVGALSIWSLRRSKVLEAVL